MTARADLVRGTIVSLGGKSDDDARLWEQFDSLDIVELLVRLEDHIPGARLLGNDEVLREGGPLETVGSLIEYLEEK